MDNHYIAGFVDGEGSFHVAFQRSDDVKVGWQAVPEFHLSQNGSSLHVLEAIRERLGCGYIKENHRRRDNDRTYVLVVRKREDLSTKVIPFFEQYPLHTAKRRDFETFKTVVEMMRDKLHLFAPGFSEIVELAYSMNARGYRRRVPKQEILRSLKSSETIRRRPVALRE